MIDPAWVNQRSQPIPNQIHQQHKPTKPPGKWAKGNQVLVPSAPRHFAPPAGLSVVRSGGTGSARPPVQRAGHFSRAASRRRDRLQVFYLHGQELFQLHPPLHPPHLLPAHPALLCLWTHFSIGILPWSFNSLGLPAIFSSTFARTQLSDPLIFSQRVRRCGSQVFQHPLQHASLPCLQIGSQHRSPAAALTRQSNVPALPASLMGCTPGHVGPCSLAPHGAQALA